MGESGAYQRTRRTGSERHILLEQGLLHQANLDVVLQGRFDMGCLVHKGCAKGIHPQLLDNKTEPVLLLASK